VIPVAAPWWATVYFDSPYYVYPDGPIAVEALRVIGAAMAQAGLVGLGRLTLSRRERMVMVEPRGTGMALFTLRAAGEVRATSANLRRTPPLRPRILPRRLDLRYAL
jgi:DNA end-binding protein Ku